MIELENKKIYDFLVMKDGLVNEGREVSKQIEKLEARIVAFENREKNITGKVKVPKEIEASGEKITEEINAKMRELEKVGREIEQMKLEAIPAEMKKEHLALLEEKEKLERERNKIALKVQKIKDRVVPTIQKVVKPLLKDEYDDIETAKIKGDKVVITTFNYLADWKSKFNKR